MRTRGRMADTAWLADQYEHRYDPHVLEVNEWVDGLQRPDDGLSAPYIAPYYGGERARVLTVLRDPGAMAHHDGGSGFLCMENDDPTSLRQRVLFEQVGITPDDLIPWNAYPYYIDRAPRPSELARGAEILVDLLSLASMAGIRAVLLQGAEATGVWRRVLRANPNIEGALALRVFSTVHPSPSALRTAVPGERERREAQRVATYEAVARLLREDDLAPA